MWFWSLFIVVPLFCYCCALFLAIAGLFVWLLHECCCHYYVVKRRTLWHAALNDWRCLVIPMLCVTKSSMSLCFWPFHKPFCLLPNLWFKNNLAKEICVTLTHYCFLQMVLCCEVCFVYVIRVPTAHTLPRLEWRKEAAPIYDTASLFFLSISNRISSFSIPNNLATIKDEIYTWDISSINWLRILVVLSILIRYNCITLFNKERELNENCDYDRY